MANQVEMVEPWVVCPSTGPEDPLAAEFVATQDGESVIETDGNDEIIFASLEVRELVRLAPKMLALLRDLEWEGSAFVLEGSGGCPQCGAEGSAEYPGKHEDGCVLAEILNAVDAVRKGT